MTSRDGRAVILCECVSRAFSHGRGIDQQVIVGRGMYLFEPAIVKKLGEVNGNGLSLHKLSSSSSS